MKKKLRLYIWTNHCCDYTDGLAFAIASSKEEARKLVEGARGLPIRDGDWGDLEVRPLNKRVGRQVSGGG